MRIATSAKFRAGRCCVPEKITSSMAAARMLLCEVSPMTQRSASSRLDLPQPFGPTTPVKPGSTTSSVGSTKDLKPISLSRLICTMASRSPSLRLPFGERRYGPATQPLEATAAPDNIGSTIALNSSGVSTCRTCLVPMKKVGVPMTPSSRPRSFTQASPSIRF